MWAFWERCENKAEMVATQTVERRTRQITYTKERLDREKCRMWQCLRALLCVYQVGLMTIDWSTVLLHPWLPFLTLMVAQKYDEILKVESKYRHHDTSSDDPDKDIFVVLYAFGRAHKRWEFKRWNLHDLEPFKRWNLFLGPRDASIHYNFNVPSSDIFDLFDTQFPTDYHSRRSSPLTFSQHDPISICNCLLGWCMNLQPWGNLLCQLCNPNILHNQRIQICIVTNLDPLRLLGFLVFAPIFVPSLVSLTLLSTPYELHRQDS